MKTVITDYYYRQAGLALFQRMIDAAILRHVKETEYDDNFIYLLINIIREFIYCYWKYSKLYL